MVIFYSFEHISFNSQLFWSQFGAHFEADMSEFPSGLHKGSFLRQAINVDLAGSQSKAVGFLITHHPFESQA